MNINISSYPCQGIIPFIRSNLPRFRIEAFAKPVQLVETRQCHLAGYHAHYKLDLLPRAGFAKGVSLCKEYVVGREIMSFEPESMISSAASINKK
jgi:hypothetical protein